MEFEGRRALVTGAAKGIGRATAIQLAREGAQVVALSRDLHDLNTLREETNCDILQVDLRDVGATRAAVRKIEPVELLVNCAGITILESFLDTKIESFDEIMAVNVRAALVLGQEVARRLIELKRKGAIVNVSSGASFIGQFLHTAYGTSKGALDSLTMAMAVELGPQGIRANAVNPTVTMTAMGVLAWSDPAKSGPMLKRIPLGRFAEASEIADAILYLLSDRASMINGVCLRVDGGQLIS
jgi:NAD(P)-dependent dehydrogenase (short-subunit alcohol dehydrogenase family)